MTPEFILASNSPRRREILSMLGMDFTVKVSDCDENVNMSMSPDRLVCELAKRKAEAVYSTFCGKDDFIVLGADTIVWDGKNVLGKPASAEDAKNTLRALSGHEHSVYTGVALLGRIGGKETVSVKAQETRVRFANLTDSEIDYYVRTGEPMDKAGSYGIQGFGGIFVSELHGDYYNVVGLPISLMRQMLLSDFSLDTDSYIGKAGE